MPFALLILSGHREGEAFPVAEGQAVTIGRDEGNTILLKDRNLSRIHCQIEILSGSCHVTDLNSTNGTVVNAQRIYEPTPIEPDDEVEVGITRLRLAELSPAEMALATAQRAAAAKAEARQEIHCEECGKVITEEESATGKASSVSNRHYCPTCRATFEMPATARPGREEAEPEPVREMFQPGQEIAGVRIISLIGDGRLGPLYKGEQMSMRRVVALKILTVEDEDWAKRYLNAVYASGELVHPDIALIFDTGEEDGNFYVIREYVEGQSAQERVAGHQRVPLDEAYRIITEVIHAIEHAFDRHILHGNLSLRKILLGKNQTVKVAGFGLPLTPPRGSSVSQYSWHALPYMAPERVRSGAESDSASEVYSLAAILYHLLTGRPPFSGSTREKIERRILNQQPKPLAEFAPDLPEAAQRIIDRGLLKDQRSRYQTPRELLYEIEENLRPKP